jgi:hypothetical protein
MAVKTYDSSEVHLILGGTPIGGFARDSGIKVTFPENQMGHIEDNRGNVARYSLNSYTCLIEINLTQDSSGNDFMMELAEFDRVSKMGITPMMLNDGNGTTIISSPEAWVEKIAEPEFMVELGIRTWDIRAINIQRWVGGL